MAVGDGGEAGDPSRERRMTTSASCRVALAVEAGEQMQMQGNCAAAAEAEGCGRCSMPLHLYYKSGNSGTEPYIVAHDLVTAGLDEAGIKHLGDRVAGEGDAAAMADGKPDDEGKGGEARTYHQREVQYVGGGTPASRRRATTSWGGAGRRSLGEESGGGGVFTSRVATSPNPRAPPQGF
ncbi:hypothetical protein TRIUR3_11680 [Triticum urartu]|uniref:Uncharacterized protein n=1 Tax=Triticum urartu TaxID=4572 RepID=M8A4P0_TRIUA|nr:hypothetical protein TRIUR3_11680 [Triticum urartu]